jgi:hypothetical protein
LFCFSPVICLCIFHFRSVRNVRAAIFRYSVQIPI